MRAEGFDGTEAATRPVSVESEGVLLGALRALSLGSLDF